MKIIEVQILTVALRNVSRDEYKETKVRTLEWKVCRDEWRIWERWSIEEDWGSTVKHGGVVGNEGCEREECFLGFHRLRVRGNERDWG